MRRCVIVGAGILGTMHAWMAVRAGWNVVLLDRHSVPRGATVRNFGLVWVSGRAPGAELEAALRARSLWQAIGTEVPGVGFRPDGSVTVVTTESELAVIQEVMERPDAQIRGFEYLSSDRVRQVNPVLQGDFLGGLHCTTDAVVEPRRALGAIREKLAELPGGTFSFVGDAVVADIATGSVTDTNGRRFEGEVIIVCTGAEGSGAVAQFLENAPLRRCRLQMMQTEPLGETLTTSVADGDSLRYYPCFGTASLGKLDPQPEVAERLHMQLLISQRSGGELTIGDTHDYLEPFSFDLEEEAYEHMAGRAAAIFGRSIPPIRRRWAGVYSQVTDGSICWRSQVADGIWMVTGPGGRGMTLSPAIAEETISQIEGVRTK